VLVSPSCHTTAGRCRPSQRRTPLRSPLKVF